MSLEQKVEKVKALLAEIDAEYAPAAFASSFGAEDMVLTDLIARHFPQIEIFSLDTGRLPEDTYRLMQQVKQRYGLVVKTHFPDAAALERYVGQHGANAFYDSVELRKECCRIRKVEPLQRALAGKRAWITGMRQQQAVTRQELKESEFDAERGIQKFNPLAAWTQFDVWTYLRGEGVPFNALHDQGYASIGCAPCTRAITPGEDVRAGRWWWENPENKECGLHPSRTALKRA